MADFQGVAAAGRSLERFLNHCFGEHEPVPGKSTKAVLVRTEDLQQDAASGAIVMPAGNFYFC